MTTSLRRWSPVIVVAVLLGILKAESIADPNVLWGIRDGRTILSSRDLPHSDAWSWTVPGKHWVPNSWGWDVVLGGLDRIGGGAALALLNIVVVIALTLVMARRAFALDARPLGMAAALAVVGGLTLLPWINDRPQLISYVFVALIVPVVAPALRASRRRYTQLLAVLFVFQVVWVNLHFFAIAGPVLVAVAGLGAVLQQWRAAEVGAVSLREHALRAVAAAAVAFAGCCVTPYGAVVAAKTVAVRNDAAGLIDEWRPAGFATSSQITGVLAIVAALVAGAYAYRARRRDITAVLAALTIGTALACRMAPVTAVIAIPELAAALSVLAERKPRTVVTVTALFALVGVGIIAGGLGSFGKLDPASTSRDLVDRLPDGCRLLNDYPLGGSVILFRPDIAVAIDSRTDLYGKQRILANRDLVAGDDKAVQTLESEGITCVLIPSGSGLVTELKKDSQWQVVDTDSRRTLLVKR